MTATHPPIPTTTADIFTDYFDLLSKNSSQSVYPVPNGTGVESVSLSVRSVLLGFKQWLEAKKLSAVSIRNYISDVSQFLATIKGESLSSVQGDSISVPAPILDSFTINPSHFLSYRNKLAQSGLPRTTINRKLASLRQLGAFLEEVHHLTNPTDKLVNISQPQIDNWLKNFHYHLRTRHHKSKTITNYVSDIRHYLIWATAQQTNTD